MLLTLTLTMSLHIFSFKNAINIPNFYCSNFISFVQVQMTSHFALFRHIVNGRRFDRVQKLSLFWWKKKWAPIWVYKYGPRFLICDVRLATDSRTDVDCGSDIDFSIAYLIVEESFLTLYLLISALMKFQF